MEKLLLSRQNIKHFALENYAARFLERYREIEEWVLDNLNVSEMKDLEQMPKFRNIRSNLSFCRYLRNILSHHDWTKAGKDLIIVTETALKQVNSLYYALNPITIMRLAVHANQIFAPTLQDKVFKTMEVMDRNGYSYVPVLENQVVKGVFSAKTVMSILTHSSVGSINENMTFNDILPLIDVNNSTLQKFDFISPDETVDDATMKFQLSQNRKKRLDLLFVTENGARDGKLLAMLTPADLIRK